MRKKRKLKYSRQAGLFFLIFFAVFTPSLATESAFSATNSKYHCEARSDLRDRESVLDEMPWRYADKPFYPVPARTTPAPSSDASQVS